MPQPSDADGTRRRWVLPRSSLIFAAALGLLILALQVSTWLPNSFRIEIFGLEILEVQNLDDTASGDEAVEERPAERARPLIRPPAPAPRPEAPTPEVFVVVEQMPELIGGLASIQRHIRYPEVAKLAGIEGRVILQFVVDEQGLVMDPKVVRGIGGGCDEEALRVLRQAQFRPGKQRGQTVPVKMSIPITFKLR